MPPARSSIEDSQAKILKQIIHPTPRDEDLRNLSQGINWAFLTTPVTLRNSRSDGHAVTGTPLQIALKSINGGMARFLSDCLEKFPDGKTEMWRQVNALSLSSAALEFKKEREQDRIELQKVYTAIKEENEVKANAAIAEFDRYLKSQRQDGFENIVDLIIEAYKLFKKHNADRHLFKSKCLNKDAWDEDKLLLFTYVIKTIEYHLPGNLWAAQTFTNALNSVREGREPCYLNTYAYFPFSDAPETLAIDSVIYHKKDLIDDVNMWSVQYNPDAVFTHTEMSCQYYLSVMNLLFESAKEHSVNVLHHIVATFLAATMTATFVAIVVPVALYDLGLFAHKKYKSSSMAEQNDLNAVEEGLHSQSPLLSRPA